MARVVVTGVAGFIGSHLAERLVADGLDVVGVDCFTDYYDAAIKRRNLAALQRHKAFTLLDVDVRTADLGPALEGASHVVHLAAQPGVRASWGSGLRGCMDHNVTALGNLLHQCRNRQVARIVVASSSSVYGNAPEPVAEDHPVAPISPYGVSKSAAEALCSAYSSSFELPTVLLRYFTVYGPRQRPDMLVARLLASTLGGPPVPIFGNGHATRDFTYVADVVDATVAAMTRRLPPGTAINIASGAPATVNDVVAMLARHAGRAPTVDYVEPAPGDAVTTAAVIQRAHSLLAWQPRVPFADGLAAQAAWAAGEAAPFTPPRPPSHRVLPKVPETR